MKISSSTPTQTAGLSRAAKGSAPSGGFSLGVGAAAEATGAAPATGVSGVSSMGALLALQAEEGPLERRRRAVSRAGRILDSLDGLKLSILEGAASPASLQSLVNAVREERAEADDPRLQDLLNEIETRAAVELAKLGRRDVGDLHCHPIGQCECVLERHRGRSGGRAAEGGGHRGARALGGFAVRASAPAQ